MVDRPHPLVTFALFAYNQEKYIREAVEGAFAQTYEPLEIVLSDDHSSDRTFAIMQEMALAYTGPHHIRVRQSQENRGLLRHINEASQDFNGAITVVAAGDDVSSPKRVETIAAVFDADPRTAAVYSEVIDTVKSNKEDGGHFEVSQISRTEIFFNVGGVGTGATYAYATPIFKWPTLLPPNLVSEDKLLPARACLAGKVKFIPKSLVYYRVLDTGLHQQLKKSGKLARQNGPHIAELEKLLREAQSAGLIGFPSLLTLTLIMKLRVLLHKLERNRTVVIGVVFRVCGRSITNTVERMVRTARRTEPIKHEFSD